MINFKQLKACLYKEFIEIVRGRRIWVYFLVAVGMAALNIFSVFLLKTLLSGDLIGMSFDSLSYFVTSFNSNMYSTYLLVCVFMMMGLISAEIKTKKWVTPLFSGIKPSNMIYAKLIIHTLVILFCTVIAFLINAVAGAIMFTVDMSLLEIVLSCLYLSIITVYICVLTITLSAITKKSALAAVTSCVLIFLSSILVMFLKFMLYTPFVFYGFSINTNLKLTTSQTVSAILTYVISAAALIFLSVFLNNKFKRII